MNSSEFLNMLKIAHDVPNCYNNKFPKNLGYYDGSKYSFDCWNLIKVVLSGWKPTGVKGSYIQPSELVTGDIDGATLLKKCSSRSKDFTKLSVPGTYLYLASNPHSGIYIGDTVINGKIYNVIECTKSFGGGVVYSWVDADGTRRNKKGGVKNGKWTHHGKFTPWVEYEVEKPKEEKSGSYYYVKSGDTLSSIAKKFGLTMTEIAKLNPQIKNLNVIHVGDKIVVEVIKIEYTVRKGDTLSQIARNHGMTLKDILELNPQIKDANKISIGQTIRVK